MTDLDDEPALAESAWARVRAGMAGDDGEPMPPGAAAAYHRGLATVFGDWRKLVSLGVLVVVLLAPTLPAVGGDVATFLATFVVASLVPVTYVRRDGATARVSLGWLGTVGVVCATCAVAVSIPWFGIAAVLVLVPAFALTSAAWMLGSWRRAGAVVGGFLRSTPVGTTCMALVANVAFSWMFLLPAFALFGGSGMPWIAWTLLGVTYLLVQAAFGLGYAQVAVERADAEPVSLP